VCSNFIYANGKSSEATIEHKNDICAIALETQHVVHQLVDEYATFVLEHHLLLLSTKLLHTTRTRLTRIQELFGSTNTIANRLITQLYAVHYVRISGNFAEKLRGRSMHNEELEK